MDDITFKDQFPIGLPVGLTKPNLTVSYLKGIQSVRWQETDELTVLEGDIYPDFCMFDLAHWVNDDRLSKFCEPKIRIDNYGAPSWTIIHNLCQTETEKLFWRAYVSKYILPHKRYVHNNKQWTIPYSAVRDRVPALVPQVWIQWNNQATKYINRMSYTDIALYRVDFAVFWNNKMYIILIDGIQHYAKQQGNRWDADEEKYAARLKEDRWLRLQGWEVFRTGNWEIRDETRRMQVLEELRDFVDFPKPPPMPQAPPPIPDDEDLPF